MLEINLTKSKYTGHVSDAAATAVHLYNTFIILTTLEVIDFVSY